MINGNNFAQNRPGRRESWKRFCCLIGIEGLPPPVFQEGTAMKTRIWKVIGLALLTCSIAIANPAMADGRGHWDGHREGHGGGWGWGWGLLGLSLGLALATPSYAAPAPVYYYPPAQPAIVQAPAYVEPAAPYYSEPVAPPPPAYSAPQAANNWWYFCQESGAYYPYVRDCPGGWLRVAPTPQ